MKDYRLNSNSKITSLFIKAEVEYWRQAIEYVKMLPYGRNEKRSDFSLVMIEKKGTCSSKHALLKLLATENNIPNVKLILCIYKMNSTNTDNISEVLNKYNLEYIPEAHCYLEVDGEKYDCTKSDSNFKRLENDIISEKEIDPTDVIENKIRIHKNIIDSEIEKSIINYSSEAMWTIREECIKSMES